MTEFPVLLAFTIPANLQPIVALVAGILIFIRPKLLSLIVAVYLIATGVMGLLN